MQFYILNRFLYSLCYFNTNFILYYKSILMQLFFVRFFLWILCIYHVKRYPAVYCISFSVVINEIRKKFHIRIVTKAINFSLGNKINGHCDVIRTTVNHIDRLNRRV